MLEEIAERGVEGEEEDDEREEEDGASRLNSGGWRWR